MQHLVLAACSAVLGLTTTLEAQAFRVTRTGGALGKTLTLDLTGPSATGFVMIPSLGAGPIPLSVLDATDNRVLEVGLDLGPLLVVGVFQLPKVTIPYAIPNDSSLLGKSLHFHGFTFPGSTRLVGRLSNPVRAAFGRTTAWTSRGNVLPSATAIPTSSTLRDGRVLVAGGGTGNLLSARGLNTSALYDPDRQRFTAGPRLTTARALHQAVTLGNGKVLLIGGANAQGAALRTCEFYDPATNRFTAAPSMSRGRAGHTATLLRDGRVLVTGGSGDLTDASRAIFGTVSSCEIYNPATNSWSGARSMGRRRLGHMAVRLGNGRVLVSGGATVNFILPGVTSTAEIYDPGSNRWSGTGSMTYSAAAHILTPLADGRVLSIGGAVLSGLTNITTTNRSSVYNPSTGRWTAGSNMRSSRALPSVVRAPDGRVLAIGGAQGSLTAPRALAACEWFNPSTRSWSAAPTLTAARAGAIALARPEGLVFVAGGAGGSQNTSLATGEILYFQ